MSSQRLNVIILQGEDSGRALGCYGEPNADTPNLDALAESGIRFDQAFSTSPVCAPSRCTTITGQYPWRIGAHHMRSKLLELPRLMTHVFRDAGYFVNWFTKTDFNFDPPEDFADGREEWLDDLRVGELPDQPFLLYKNFDVTHESTMCGPNSKRWCAANTRIVNEHLIEPERMVKPDDVMVPSYLPDTFEVRTDLARFYNAQIIADIQIGEVLDALEASPYRDNTIVIYLTDHGRGQWREKRWCYEAGIHLSLLMRVPGMDAGVANDELVSWVDLPVTIMSLCGVTVPEEMEGQVFLGEGAAEPREAVFAGRDRMGEVYDRVRAVREKRFHYIRNFHPELPYGQYSEYMNRLGSVQVIRELHAQGRLNAEQSIFMAESRPVEELYDAVADPEMLNNLADDPAYASDLERLRNRLDEHLNEKQDLAEFSEQALVDMGLVEDVLPTYRAKCEVIPERYRLAGLEKTVVEMPE